MASCRTISRRACFFPAGSAKANLRAQLRARLSGRQLSDGDNQKEVAHHVRTLNPADDSADHLCWMMLRRQQVVELGVDEPWVHEPRVVERPATFAGVAQ